MATVRANARLQVGSVPWIAEERGSALQIAAAEAEEFAFSARNEVEWLNEHMAEIFSENNVNVAEIFKTPGKLRGKTPRTARKANPLESRPPLSDVFSSTPRGAPSPFKQTNYERPIPTFQVAEDEPSPEESIILPAAAGPISPIQRKPVPTNHFDSGYFGSQAVTSTQPNEAAESQPTQVNSPPKADMAVPEPIEEEVVPTRESESSFESAKEEQSGNVPEEMEVDTEVAEPSKELNEATRPVLQSPFESRTQQASSPQKRSPQRSPERPAAVLSSPPEVAPHAEEPEPAAVVEDEPMEDVQSPTSDGSSPIRPVVRKSSLNFASLPAREPITTKKSIGARVSRTSQLDQTRTSYYGRATGGKSLGTTRQEELDNDDDDMDVDMDDTEAPKDDTDSKMTRLHNKTSTQRLQDQISMLGQSQTNARPASKSIAGSGFVASQSSYPPQAAPAQRTRLTKSPQRKERPPPGAFPEDEEDSWIGPPTVAPREPSVFSPRPQLPKSHSTDVMEGIHGTGSIGGSEFNLPKRGDASPRRSPQRSPLREPIIPERTTSTLGHIKSASTSILRSPKRAGDSPGGKKGVSVSNPTPSIHTINENESTTPPPKSPSRTYRGSPLKAAKDKFSSILKTSRGLFASSAAVSADAKTSTLSPASNRPGVRPTPSFEDALTYSNDNENLYPTLNNSTSSQQYSQHAPKSPVRGSTRKTRASTEKEERQKEEQAREAKEAREAQKMADQLGKARNKVKEEARVYHLEQERVAAMQKEVQARKEQEQQAKQSQADLPRATRSSPRKTKAQLEAEGIAAAASSTDDVNRDAEMSDASAMPPPAVPRPKSQIGRPGPKRPLKPSKEPLNKAKPPTVIRVDTGSQRGHQYHPSTSSLSSNLQETLSAPGPSQNSLKKKASTSSIASKASTNSFKSAASKALESAARKKEQDELAAQRKREAKQEVERQRAANKEEERRKEEQQRRQEAERQRELQRERERAAAAADAKKSASRQAIEKRRLEMEKAKQMGAPPPAVRGQPSGDSRHAMQRDKELPPVPVQRNEMGQSKSGAHRPQEDLGRSVNGGMQNPAKVPPKRPLQQDDEHSRPQLQRNGPSYHTEQHSKRRKTSEGFDDDDDTIDHPKMTAPPIRQSSSRPKDVQTKSLFPSGYTTAPPSNNLQRNTLISQHNMNQSKPAHPMDMAQVSKAPIPF
ncbi:hypothetical protein LSUE1_G006105, partial [Lachnellula suecica]